MTNFCRIIALAIICTVGFTSCTETKQTGKLTIVTTTGIVGDCVAQIVGDQAEVISLMGAGVDPHLYKVSQGDISKLASADIIVYSGLHLEGKMAKMLENYSKQKPAFALGSYVSKSKLKRVDETSDLVDPHIWFNPEIWMEGLGGVANELSKIEGLEKTTDNYTAYSASIMSSTQALKSLLDSSIAVERRILITSHDAFAYFGDAFNFKVRGLQGISTAAEYGVKDLKNLIDYVIDNSIKSVFVETSVSDKNLQAVIEGAKQRGYDLQIGGTLYSDALGKEGTDAGTYKGMLEANVVTITKGLK
ncbi:zinc ABC transporter substrate-binding protein [Bacteroidia bacterium]|nr:zinc ABC transporter substrate-binding protein [Bacteroidia bacterium]MDB4107417.1 zinc ABC transporter substrate-binding protein [Bacteroidia bacterium]MDB9883261.1 zinc ABC transporter substrate-binding protein [Bacteroidia bacterium]